MFTLKLGPVCCVTTLTCFGGSWNLGRRRRSAPGGTMRLEWDCIRFTQTVGWEARDSKTDPRREPSTGWTCC